MVEKLVSQFGWANCPGAVRTQVNNFLKSIQAVLDNDLVGVYLHGSLAFGCFNPSRSDVDLLVVTESGMTVETKRAIAELLLQSSNASRPFEISFLSKGQLQPWRYPTPYDFHYSEDWREKVERELADETWRGWNDGAPVDADLAAHIAVTLHRGLCLHGKPIAEIFSAVPREHYLASVLADFDWGRERLAANPVYFLLNACRIFAYWCDGLICSKDEGGVWALRVLPEEFRGLVVQAVAVYRGESDDENFDAATLAQLAAYIKERLTR